MSIYLFILLQAANNGPFGGGLIDTIIKSIVVFAICAGIFLLVRSILLWYWKVDIIVTNQESQTGILQRQNDLIREQTSVLNQMSRMLGNYSFDPKQPQHSVPLQSQNVIGQNSEIQYQEKSGVYRTAKLDAPRQGDIVGVHDPEFQVKRYGEDNWNGSFQWLTYLGPNGETWVTRTHASFTENGFDIKLETHGPGHPACFYITDWSNKLWRVNSVTGSTEGSIFHLEEIAQWDPGCSDPGDV